MAAPDRQQQPDIHRSEQGVQNWSFDEVYKVLATIPVGEYNNSLYRLQVNPSGALTVDSTISGSVTAYAKPSEQYAIYNKEATATYKYFGFQKADGYWYIMRKTIATNVFEYAAGASAYSTAWTNRASQTYTDYATAF